MNIRGMTLVEVLVALAIFIAVMVAVAAFEAGIFTHQQTVSSSYATAQDTQILLRNMLTELREAAPAMNGVYTITVAGTSTISFFTDPDNDGQTEQITYTLIGNKLYRATIQPVGTPPVYNPATQATTTILTDVRNSTSTPVFQYYDQNFTGTSTPLTYPLNILAIRLIKVTLTLDTDPNRAPGARTYTINASLRNLKTNL